MIMKRLVVLLFCVLMCLTGCQFDPYSNQRPSDYGDAIWTCGEFNIWFVVDTKKEDYYYPEGELQNNGVAYFCKFYFIHQTNQLHINVYPLEYESVPDASRDRSAVVGTIKGECVFSNDSLVFKIDTVTGILHGEIPTTLTFRRSSIEETPCTF